MTASVSSGRADLDQHVATPLSLHGYLTPRYESADCSAAPMAWARATLAEL